MKWRTYQKYKPSGVEWPGEIPEHWEVVRFKYMLWLQRGHDLPVTEFHEGKYPVCGSNGCIGYHNQFTTKGPGVTVGRSGSVGEVNYIATDYWAHNTALYVKEFRRSIPRYAFYLLKTLDVRYLSEGTAVGTLNRNYIHDLPIAIPPSPEQHTIAAFLDRETARIDTLIEKKERQIELLQEKRGALISHAVTRGLNPNVKMKDSGVEWLGEIPEHWGVAAFRRFITRIEQGWSPQAEQRIAEEDEWAVLKVGAVYKGSFRIEEQKALPKDLDPNVKCEVQEGDLLLTRGNTPELVADACIVPRVRRRLMLSDLHYRLVLNEDKCLRPFACYWLISYQGRIQIQSDAHGTSNSMVKVSQSQIRSWVITCPPLDEQKDIINQLDIECAKIAGLIKNIEHSINLLQEYRMAVITAAVTGWIDVRGEVA